MNKKNITKNMLAIIASLIIFYLCTTVTALAKDANDAQKTLESNITEVLSLLKSPELQGISKEERAEKILDVVDVMFDFSSFSQGALGANWRRFSSDDRSQFTSVFARLIARNYLNQLDNQNIEDFEVFYLDNQDLKATKSGTLRADVFTQVRYNDVRTPVDYRMLNRGDGWRIYDVKIEGISMVANYRKQYQKKFMQSPEQIIQEVKDKLQTLPQ